MEQLCHCVFGLRGRTKVDGFAGLASACWGRSGGRATLSTSPKALLSQRFLGFVVPGALRAFAAKVPGICSSQGGAWICLRVEVSVNHACCCRTVDRSEASLAPSPQESDPSCGSGNDLVQLWR